MNKLYLGILLSISVLIASEQKELFLESNFQDEIAQFSSYSIAILPFENATMEPEISYHFRQRIAQLLRAKGYTVIDFETLNQKLINLGIQSADQLSLINISTLTRMSSANAIISGIVETAASQNAALYSGYAYTGSLKLQDSTGKVLWYHLSQRVAKRRLAIDPVNMLLNTMLESDDNKSKEAISAVADILIEPFPQGPIQVVNDDLLSQAIEL